MYYESVGEPCPEEVNPLDHVIDVALTKGSEVDERFFAKYQEDPNGFKFVLKKIESCPRKVLEH